MAAGAADGLADGPEDAADDVEGDASDTADLYSDPEAEAEALRHLADLRASHMEALGAVMPETADDDTNTATVWDLLDDHAEAAEAAKFAKAEAAAGDPENVLEDVREASCVKIDPTSDHAGLVDCPDDLTTDMLYHAAAGLAATSSPGLPHGGTACDPGEACKAWCEKALHALHTLAFIQSPACQTRASGFLSVVEHTSDSPALGQPEKILRYIHWDAWSNDVRAGRVVELDRAFVKYREPGWNRCNIRDFNSELQSGDMSLVVPNTTVAMIRRSGAFRARMREEVLDYVRFIHDCWAAALAIDQLDAEPSGASSLRSSLALGEDPCCICLRRPRPAKDGHVQSSRVCPMCTLSMHACCAEQALEGEKLAPFKDAQAALGYSDAEMLEATACLATSVFVRQASHDPCVLCPWCKSLVEVATSLHAGSAAGAMAADDTRT